ncbi:Dual specificity protein phosphatase 10 [Podila verticillata]|nr:Dual specificity protein phosphatase 10 [Podila verticillata]
MPSYEPPAPLFVTEASAPPLTRPTSHSFSLHRPNLDAKKTRNAKRLSLVVPPSPGVLENLAAISTPSFPPSSFSRRPFTPARMPTINSSTTSEVPTTPTASGASKRHSQFLLENALPTPRFPVANAKPRRPISAYFSDFSVECGTASPYTSEPVCVLPHLYLGAEHNASDSATLSRLGISHVLNVAVEIAQQSQEELVEKNGIRYHHLSWTHHQKNLSSEFPEAFDHIEQARSSGGKILVHCQLGVSRSASLVIAYVMKAENKSLTEAYDFVKDRSGVISPNMSLMYQLAEFEKSLRGTGSGSGSVSGKRDNRIFDQEEPSHGGFPSEEDMDVDDHSPRPTPPQAPSSKRNSLVLNLGPGSGSSSEQKPFKPMTRPRSTYRHSLLGAEAAASVAAAVPKTPLTDRFSFDRASLAYPPLSALNNPGNGSTRLTTVEASPTTPSFVTDFASMGSSFSDAPSSASCSMSSRPSSTSSTTMSTYSTSFSRAMGNGGSTLPSPPSPTVVPRRSSKGAVDRDSVVSPRRSGSWGAHAPLSMVPPPSPWMNTSHGSQRKRQSFQALERDDTEDTASSVGLTTTTTTTTTTPGASEFIFSPRPCSPPLLETHNFGDFYQALRMEG